MDFERQIAKRIVNVHFTIGFERKELAPERKKKRGGYRHACRSRGQSLRRHLHMKRKETAQSSGAVFHVIRKL